MPEIKMKHIVSFSSEDPAHPADNLLKCETYRKWQCADSTGKQVSVVIELEKASKIHSIDIGNNGSAFVEVLAGRSSFELSHDFQVLLVSSSFMSPAESKSATNINRVRMFGPEKLSKATADQKWDRIKFICTQPYNKTSCYGLSFVNLHSPPECQDKVVPAEKVPSRLGAFVLKDESESTDSITSGSLFLKRKEKSETPKKSTAAELREASKHPETVETARHDLKNKLSKENGKKEMETVLTPKRKAESSSLNNVTKISNVQDNLAQPASKKVKVIESKERAAPLHDILKNVVFVLSGFKNPERGHLRDKALSMGARYRGDWDTTCTHLICAFSKTPKYNQVKATSKGKIVSKSWISDCHKRRKRLSDKRYRLKGDSSDDSESSTEDEAMQPSHRDVPQYSAVFSSATQAPTTDETTKDDVDTKANTSKGIEKESADSDNRERMCDSNEEELSSGHDTEDEIRRVMGDKEDPYDGSTECETDEEDENNIKDKGETSQPSSRNLLELPDFFSNMIFFLYGKFEQDERRTLTRYISAYDGILEEYMSGNVKYIITKENWDVNFNEALIDNSALTFVRPKWIYVCHEKSCFVPYQPYIVVPH